MDPNNRNPEDGVVYRLKACYAHLLSTLPTPKWLVVSLLSVHEDIISLANRGFNIVLITYQLRVHTKIDR